MNLAGRYGYGCWFWSTIPALGITSTGFFLVSILIPSANHLILFLLGIGLGVLNGRFNPFPPVVKDSTIVKETKQE